MKKKVIFIIFALLLLAIPLFLMLNSERVLEDGYRHKIKLQAYDPFDPFRGKYLRINYDNSITGEFMESGETVYVTLAKDSAGFSYFDKGLANKPETDDYFKSTVLYSYSDQINFRTDNISKYFINEDKAKPAENVMFEYQRNHPNDIYVAIRVLDGEIRLEDIYVEEVALLDFLDQKAE